MVPAHAVYPHKGRKDACQVSDVPGEIPGYLTFRGRVMTQSMVQSPKPHTVLAKTFHWGFIVIFAYAVIKQVGTISDLGDTALLRFEVFFALGFLGLLVARFVYMRLTRPTALPEGTPRMMKLMARAGHLAIYVSLGSIALSGLMIAAVYSMYGPENWMIEPVLWLHESAVAASYLTIGIHISAAVFHRIKGDGIWSAMVPVFKERPTDGA
jgi:cytochrome b561